MVLITNRIPMSRLKGAGLNMITTNPLATTTEVATMGCNSRERASTAARAGFGHRVLSAL
jgi:hypothetical protein